MLINLTNLDPENVGWHYLPGTSQELALSTIADHILYCGTRGPGKTDTQLARFYRNVGKGYGSFWRGIIFDQEYKNLDDLVNKSKRMFFPLGDGARWLASGKDYKWVWPTGEELLFRVGKNVDDYWNYHGQEFAFIGWNELTKYATSRLYERMMSCNRTSFTPERDTPLAKGPNGTTVKNDDKSPVYATEDGNPLPKIPLEVFSTCNPFGVGHAWVKKRFIDPAPYGTFVTTETQVFSPAEQKDITVTKRQITIFGSYKENPFLTPEYIAELHKNSDENERKAWLSGSWDIVSGGAISDLWDKKVHVLPRFAIPKHWHVDRSFDWGSSTPFSIGWWAEATGEEVELPDGSTFCPPRGSLIRIAEWYGTVEMGTNVGLKLTVKQIADGIKEREKLLLEQGWFTGKIWAGPADNQIEEKREVDKDSISKQFSDRGIDWERSNKSPGSRRTGLELLRERLNGSIDYANGDDAEAGIYWMENCTASIATLPMLQRDEKDPEDVLKSPDDHAYDETRYRVLAGNDRSAKVIRVNF